MTYPPPTLIKRRSRGAWVRYAVLLLIVAIVLGTCTASRFMSTDRSPKGTASSDIAASPDAASSATEIVEAPPAGALAEPPPAEQTAAPTPGPVPEAAAAESVAVAQAPMQEGDAREANRWYYVRTLGDGPGAIYSRTGGQWDYAFACALATRTLEFIAVNSGNPRGFDRQSMRVGTLDQPMDATYSRDGGGTISMRLPAGNRFFSALANGATVEVQLLASRRVILPVGPDLVRLIRDCRGG